MNQMFHSTILSRESRELIAPAKQGDALSDAVRKDVPSEVFCECPETQNARNLRAA